MTKLKRNDPCSCGSAMKHKKCCLKREKHSFLSFFANMLSAFADSQEKSRKTLDENRRPGSSKFFGPK